MRIHPCGRKIIFFVLILFFLEQCLFLFLFHLPLYLYLILTAFSAVLLLMILRFFRYPYRKASEVDENIVLSPADGTIVAIEETTDKFYGSEGCIQVSVFMSVHNVHLNWLPVSGYLNSADYFPGKYLLARNPKSSMLNEMVCTTITTNTGQKVVVKQIAGFMARRIIPFVKTGEQKKRCDELGFIRFGSRVDILLPITTKVFVSIGQKVKGICTEIGSLSNNKL